MLSVWETSLSESVLPASERSRFETTVIPRLSQLLRIYEVFRWLGDLKIAADSDSTSLIQMPVEMSITSTSFLQPITGTSNEGEVNLIDDLLKLVTIYLMPVANCAVDGEASSYDLRSLALNFPEFIAAVLSTLWPTDPRMLICEYFRRKGLYRQLVDFCERFDPWLTELGVSRMFYEGEAWLQLGEPDKALQCFLGCYISVTSQDMDFLNRFGFVNTSQDKLSFFLTVSHLFCEQGYQQHVIDICTKGLQCSSGHEPSLPLTWTKLFKALLKLGRFEEALTAVQKNPDSNCQKSCFRQLILKMDEENLHQQMITFKYGKLEHQFVQLLEHRARTTELSKNNFYEILSRFFCFHGNYRRAAKYMYEMATKLKSEMYGLESLRQQTASFAACIHMLSLVSENYRWIVRKTVMVSNDRL
ncbi:unnamed protein product [Soboliphyme baturini]|uniref:Tetratricopeptide repeat protein n=1 Tax=Soboliphyme baturini TaxID=241478 RepID=A0A183ITX5_9BILA|nr:unnamed protein product [Soboliphyme baturini]